MNIVITLCRFGPFETLSNWFAAVTGKTSLFRAWHLRQSFIWKDGKWIEAPKVGANDSLTHEVLCLQPALML